MDGVLIDSGAHHRDAWRSPPARARPRAGAGVWRVHDRASGRGGGGACCSAAGWRPTRRARWRAASARTTPGWPSAACCRSAASPASSTSSSRRGVPRAVATSASRGDLDALLSQVGLRGHFEVIVTAEDVRWGKPNPEVFLRAAAGLEAAADDLPGLRGLAGRRARRPQRRHARDRPHHRPRRPRAPGRRRRARHRRLRGIRHGPSERARLLGRPLRHRRRRLGPRPAVAAAAWISSTPHRRRADGWPCPGAAAATTPASWPRAATTWWASTSRRRRSRPPAHWPSETASTSPSSSATSSRSGASYAHAFDGVWEYTCFCAIDPARRDAYVRTIAAILKPGGWLLACFFPMRRVAAGPPFPVSRGRGAPPLGAALPPRARAAAAPLGPRPPGPRVARAGPLPRLTSAYTPRAPCYLIAHSSGQEVLAA